MEDQAPYILSSRRRGTYQFLLKQSEGPVTVFDCLYNLLTKDEFLDALNFLLGRVERYGEHRRILNKEVSGIREAIHIVIYFKWPGQQWDEVVEAKWKALVDRCEREIILLSEEHGFNTNQK